MNEAISEELISLYEARMDHFWMLTDPMPELQQGFLAGWQATSEHNQREADRLKDRISALESTSVVRNLEVQRNALKSRVARLDGALRKYQEFGDRSDVEDFMFKVLNESEQQSLAEVRAETLRRAATDILDELGAHNASQWLRNRMNRILQEAEDA